MLFTGSTTLKLVNALNSAGQYHKFDIANYCLSIFRDMNKINIVLAPSVEFCLHHSYDISRLSHVNTSQFC